MKKEKGEEKYCVQERHGEPGKKKKKNREKKEEMREKESERERRHTWFASSLGVSSGLQGENYCTSPPRARVTSLTTLINWKSVIAQTVLLSAC